MSSATTISSCGSFERAAMPLARRGARSGAQREKLALVIPARREAENLRLLLGPVRAVLSRLEIDFEIVVVDDDSRDGTAGDCLAIAVEDTRVRLLVRTGERGLSGAMVHGWQHTDATILGVMDADGQHPAEAVPELVAAILGGRDLVIGSRYLQPESRRGWHPCSGAALGCGESWPRARYRPAVRDPLSGFFVVRRQCVEKCFFSQPVSSCCWRSWCEGESVGGRGPVCLCQAQVRTQQIEPQGGLGLPGVVGAAVPRAIGHRSNSAAPLRATKALAAACAAAGNRHAQKEHQRHADARLAVDLGHQVAGAHIERHARRDRQPIRQPRGTSSMTSTPAASLPPAPPRSRTPPCGCARWPASPTPW